MSDEKPRIDPRAAVRALLKATGITPSEIHTGLSDFQRDLEQSGGIQITRASTSPPQPPRIQVETTETKMEPLSTQAGTSRDVEGGTNLIQVQVTGSLNGAAAVGVAGFFTQPTTIEIA